jgi:ketosteroid isomerase-like protein
MLLKSYHWLQQKPNAIERAPKTRSPAMTRRITSPEGGQTISDDVRPLSRRGAVLADLALPLASWVPVEAAPAGPELLGAEVTRLVERADRANAAFMRGDMDTWHRVAGPIAEDFTLMQPFGGPASHGFDASPERLAAMARYFASGNTELEVVETYASADLVVLVVVERQRGRVGGLPEQDWSLRVTQVYRRRSGAWELVHRHADPLVRNVGLEKTAALARGD